MMFLNVYYYLRFDELCCFYAAAMLLVLLCIILVFQLSVFLLCGCGVIYVWSFVLDCLYVSQVGLLRSVSVLCVGAIYVLSLNINKYYLPKLSSDSSVPCKP
jgi:hypothetical protein